MAPSEEINIPQKPPMVMVDRLVLADGPVTVTAFSVREDNVFADERALYGTRDDREHGPDGGRRCRSIRPGATGQPPRTGFIGGIKDLIIFRLPAVGEEIETTVNRRTHGHGCLCHLGAK